MMYIFVAWLQIEQFAMLFGVMKTPLRILGFVKFHTAVFLVVVGFLGYSGYTVGKFYYDYYSLKTFTRDILRDIHRHKDKKYLHNRIYSHIEELGMPIGPSDLRISVSNGRTLVRVDYEEYFDLLGYEIHMFEFKMEEVRKFK